MAVVTLFPSGAPEVELTGWTNAANAHSDDGVYATAAPNKNGAIASRYISHGFDAQLPADAVIDKVQVIY